MPRRPRMVPTAHGEAPGPAAGLRALELEGRVERALGGNVNMHWLLGGVRTDGNDHTAVLRRYGPWRGEEEVAYELTVLERMAELGWAVPRTLAGPVRVGRHLWALFSYARGGPRRPRAQAAVRAEMRSRGRLLARLHADLASLTDLGQRPGWLRRDEVLGPRSDGPAVEEVIRKRVVPEEAAEMLDYADQARRRFEALRGERLPVLVNHGDLIGSNVLYLKGELSGVIDFDFTHLDFRAADFVWTWRGRNDEFVHCYEEVMPLSEGERALLAPAFWVTVLDDARRHLLHRDARSETERPHPPERVSLAGNLSYLRRRSVLSGG